MVKEMKSLISSGKSPIAGKGKFPAYKGSYRSAIKKGYIKGKSLRPVNLYLTGKFLAQLKSRVLKAGSISIGFRSNKDNAQDKEDGHRTGANGQAKRPIIPQGGQEFKKSIMSIFNKAVIKAIKRIAR